MELVNALSLICSMQCSTQSMSSACRRSSARSPSRARSEAKSVLDRYPRHARWIFSDALLYWLKRRIFTRRRYQR